MDLFWYGGIVLIWLYLAFKLVTGRVKWFWFLIWVSYTLIAISLFMFLEVSHSQ